MAGQKVASAERQKAETELARLRDLERRRTHVTPVRRAPARSMIAAKDMNREDVARELGQRRAWCDHFEAGSGRPAKSITAEYDWQRSRCDELARRLGFG